MAVTIVVRLCSHRRDFVETAVMAVVALKGAVLTVYLDVAALKDAR